MSVLTFFRNGALAAWVAAALGFCIPFSTAAANVFLLLLLIAWLIMPERGRRLRLFWENPLARLALILFLALALGCLWGEAPVKERIDTLKKYGDLLLIGIMVGALLSPEQRQRALQGFAAGMTLLLLLSVSIWAGLLPEGVFGKIGAGAVVMKLSITHSWLMACFAFGCGLSACWTSSRLWRALLVLMAALALLNILFMVGGRTGYLVMAVLLVFGFYAWKGWRGLAFALLSVAVLGGAAFGVSSRLSGRVTEAIAEVQQWKPGEGARADSSMGQRLDWYRASLQIIAQKPLHGVGTGGFYGAMQQQLAGSKTAVPGNPHNEYLMFAVQLGLPGMLLLMAFFMLCWRRAAHLGSRERDLLRGVLLAMATGCLFNSFFLDFTEGLFFAWMVGVLASGQKTE